MTRKTHLFWQLFFSYWALTVASILAVAIYAFHSSSTLYFQTLEKDLSTRASLLAGQLAAVDDTQIDAFCKMVGKTSGTRFTLIRPDGTVVADSDEEPASMQNHADRPEVRQALAGKTATDRRYSQTLGEKMMYVAVPLPDNNRNAGFVIRAALPMTAITGELNKMTKRVVDASLLAGLLSMLVCIVVVRRITAPLHDMARAARQFAEGNFSRRIPAQRAVELGELAQSLNTMADRLGKTLASLAQQRNEQQAVLASMDEGVLAIDQQERIIHMNRVAGEILGINHRGTKGMLLQQAIHHISLQDFIRAAIGAQKKLSRDLVLQGKIEKQILAAGRVLENADGQAIGALVVLRDITQLRHLETVRADFVANVSHELKTPITSIKGFVETLLSSDWNHEPEALRFLDIIRQQADRLDAIIDDLLTLSRLEQQDGKVPGEPSPLSAIFSNAAALCQLQASEKNMVIQTDCPNGLTLSANAPLLEQALVNLLMNAIKYSDPGKSVQLSACEEDGQVRIVVEDQGFGIAPEHLARLFERFYRVDTARSRKLGGTGLGLSIVKHIVQVHGGTITVKSQPGTGSTFTIILPQAT